MTLANLTGMRAAATVLPETRETSRAGRVGRQTKLAAGLLMIGAGGLSGCINVAAPDEPIVIELNINIRQEVIYRLAEDAANTIDENADIF